MRVKWSIGALLWSLVSLWAVAAAQAADGRFGWLGLAPAEAGQTLQQAEAALGAALVPGAPAGKEAARCHLRSSAAQPGVSYVIDQGLVTRAETRDARYATVRGVRVGDDVKKVRQVYGQRLSVRAHAYFERGLVLAVYSPDRRFALVMESNDAGRIVTLRGGRVPAVEFLEGCSA
jgi:hypothetical protein